VKGQWFLLLPVLWAIAYAVGGILLKRALEAGAGALRIAFMNNMVLGVLFAPGLLFLPANWTWADLEWPLMASILFFCGQVFTFVAMRLGDVTVVTPTMGIKVVFVAVFAVVLKAGPVPWTWWAGSGLATIAVFLLGLSDWRGKQRAGRTAVMAMLAAAMYGICDVIVQMHAKSLGAYGFSAVLMTTAAVASFGLIPFFRAPLREMPRAAWPWALGGGAIVAVQCGGVAMTIATFGQATAVNILYSTRGLWSILIVWLAGSWFGNHESRAGRGVMGRRLAGALLLLTAVALVLIKT
jgi:drug/metabolite transporter (DMT)-like permease